MDPNDVANADCPAFESQLIPSTWVSFSSKLLLWIRNEETWWVQPPVNENI